MSRIANNPIQIPADVDVNINGQSVVIKGKQGELKRDIHPFVKLEVAENTIKFAPASNDPNADAQAGTARALVNNMVTGVSAGFEKKLLLVGVGYRSQVQGKNLNLTLGFSHPVAFEIPEGIKIETPSQTEILVKGIDKQLVGQVAADIRAYRPPEPYKGKGVRYADEHIILKEGKKK